MRSRLTLIAMLLGLSMARPGQAAEFCAELQAKHGGTIVRCVDFAKPTDAAINWFNDSGAVISTHLYDPAVSAGANTGSLHWRIRSYNQVKREEPGLSNGEAWVKALNSHNGVWQRWIGRNYTPGQTYYFQFKYRVNNAFKMQWGGGGPKVFGFDAGCRVVNGVRIPDNCDQTLGLGSHPSRVTDLGTAGSLEFATMTTTNWWPASANAPHRPYPIMYQGSSNFGLTQGFTPLVHNPTFGSSQLEQPGPDANGPWNGSIITNACDALSRLHNPDFVKDGRCVTYGAPDAWHEITIALRPSGNYYNTNPSAPAQERVFRHDTLLKVWYDGKLIVNFDPQEPPFRTGQPTAAACAALQTVHPAYDVCRTGVDMFRDSRDLPMDCATGQPSATGRCGSSFPVYPAPWIAGDPGADPSQFILWTFSYRRGYPPRSWCDSELGTKDARYNQCVGLSGSADDPANFAAFLDHAEVNVYMDDWVVSTVPLPMMKKDAERRRPRR